MDKKINFRWEVPAQALEKWDRSVEAKKADGVSINIYSTIGEYGDGAGMTAKLVSAILRNADGAPVAVNINSGGGDFFEGLAIHTLLSEYEGEVTVNVVGLAASAASVVAMAGDTINISESAFIMIHNAWTIALGNKADMRSVADMLEQFDKSMTGLYAKKTGADEREIKKMMDAETFIQGPDAVEMKFADALLGSDKVEKVDEKGYASSAMRKLDVELAKAGMPRSERRELLKELTDTPRAVQEATPRAGSETVEALKSLLSQLQKQGIQND